MHREQHNRERQQQQTVDGGTSQQMYLYSPAAAAAADDDAPKPVLWCLVPDTGTAPACTDSCTTARQHCCFICWLALHLSTLKSTQGQDLLELMGLISPTPTPHPTPTPVMCAMHARHKCEVCRHTARCNVCCSICCRVCLCGTFTCSGRHELQCEWQTCRDGRGLLPVAFWLHCYSCWIINAGFGQQTLRGSADLVPQSSSRSVCWCMQLTYACLDHF
jgi:hypothetical protein